MKTTLTISLALLFLVQSFTRSLIYLNYEVNKNYISNVLCENKEKKQLHCEGKCHLKKELAKEEEKESTPTGNSKEKFEVNLFNEKIAVVSFSETNQLIKSEFSYTEIQSQDFNKRIDHPPTTIG